jgi:hypothetical protein
LEETAQTNVQEAISFLDLWSLKVAAATVDRERHTSCQPTKQTGSPIGRVPLSVCTQVHLIARPIPWLYFSTEGGMFSTEGERFQLKGERSQLKGTFSTEGGTFSTDVIVT